MLEIRSKMIQKFYWIIRSNLLHRRSRFSFPESLQLIRKENFYRTICSTVRLDSGESDNQSNVCDRSDAIKIRVHYITNKGDKIIVEGDVGDDLMHLAQKNNIEIEGACDASLACCTCHVYIDEKFYSRLKKPEEDEEDLLDLAPFLKSNSRLSRFNRNQSKSFVSNERNSF